MRGALAVVVLVAAACGSEVTRHGMGEADVAATLGVDCLLCAPDGGPDAGPVGTDGGPSDGGWGWRCSDSAVLSACLKAYEKLGACCDIGSIPRPNEPGPHVWLCQRFAAQGIDPLTACTDALARTCDQIHADAAAKGECCCPGGKTCTWATTDWRCERPCTTAGNCPGGAAVCDPNPGGPDGGLPGICRQP